MRVTHIRTVNIAGLIDADVALPASQLVAFAGANGTGKSKLMACMLVPWTRTLPPPRDESFDSEVHVTLELSDAERDVLEEYDRAAGWGQGRPPSTVTVTGVQKPLVGIELGSDPHFLAVQYFAGNQDILRVAPSLNLLYLPAERRLLPASSTFVDLSQLTDELSLSKVAEARNAAQNYGRLDDQEFETYAKALCVAATLPSEGNHNNSVEKSQWDALKSSVDALLFPKTLEPLTRENPSELRIRLSDGATHAVHELSSGERQALIIISRVFRAGEGHSIVAIDEPDAYLHPALSSRLLTALRPGLGDAGRLIMATHSPSILDALTPDAILRLSHDEPPAVVESETERLALYRRAGFRASTLTQAEALLVTEGDFDLAVLPQLMPELGSVGLRGAGGRSEVLKTVKTLVGYDVPILGVVDADVRADEPEEAIRDNVHVWPAADIEGVLLSDKAFLQSALDGALIKATVGGLKELEDELEALLRQYEENAVAEYAQRVLRQSTSITWPSPRGDGPVQRLQALANRSAPVTRELIESALADARSAWETAGPRPWGLVRGKWVIGQFTTSVTDFKSGEAFVNAVLARRPQVAAVNDLQRKLSTLMGTHTH